MELAREESEAGEVEEGEEDGPGDEGVVDAAGGLAAPEEGPFVFVAGVDLIECEGENEEAEDGVDVVLGGTGAWAWSFWAGLDPVDEGAQGALDDVEDEDGDTPFAVRIVEVA